MRRVLGFWPFRRVPVPFGRRAEILGSLYLRKIGYRLLASPFRTVAGEVDIVAREGDCLVFVEVKARRDDLHPEDAVTGRKQARIAAAARAYRSRYGLEETPYRFDILAVVGDGEDPECRLIRDAFREPEARRFADIVGAGLPEVGP